MPRRAKILPDFELRDEPSFEEFQASVQRLYRGPDAATILLYMQVESISRPWWRAILMPLILILACASGRALSAPALKARRLRS